MRTMSKWLMAIMAVGIAAAAGSATAAMESGQLQAASISGATEWLQAGSSSWKPAVLNQKFSGGDKIRTGQDGRAVLALWDGNTIQLYAGSEFSIQTLRRDVAAKQVEYIFGISKGKLTATIPAVSPKSRIQFETPLTTIDVPTSEADPTLTITINPDGSATITVDDGTVHTLSASDPQWTSNLGSGDQVQAEFNPTDSSVTVTDVSGSFQVVGPDGNPVTLNPGDTIVFRAGGAATFIPGTPGVDGPVADTLGEPVSG